MPSLPLASPWLALALGLLAALLLLRSAPRLGAHRGRWAGVLALALGMAAYVNAYFAYLPKLGDVAGPRPWPVASARAAYQPPPTPLRDVTYRSRGAVVTLPLAGAVSRTPTQDALVYLPPQYFTQPARRFPVLYLLHGSPGVPLDWFRGGEAAVAGLASATAGSPAILVAPRMSIGWLADSECVDGPALQAESYLVDDVVPDVDRLLRTTPAAVGRGVAGNSAGGYCALTVGLRHPALFSRVAALSPLITPTYSYGSLGDLFGHPADLPAVIERHTPGWLLQHRPDSRAVQLRIDVGAADPLRRDAQGLAALDRAVGGRPQLVVRPGGHTFRVWRPALRDAVAWFARGAGPGTAGPSVRGGPRPGSSGQTLSGP